MSPPPRPPRYASEPPSPRRMWKELHELGEQVQALGGDLAQVKGELARATSVLGSGPSPNDPDGSGLYRAVTLLVRTVGHPPNAATGDSGEGLCAVVAQLARLQGVDSRGVGRAAATGGALAAGGMVAIFEVLARVWPMLMQIGGAGG